MGILYTGIHGGYQKRTGPLVGRRLGGKSVVSAIPHKSLIPRSTGQLAQQCKVSLMNSFLSGFKPIINVGFVPIKKITPMNAAFAQNFSIVFDGDYPDYKINYSKMVCSRGKLQSLNSLLVTPGDELDTIKFKWLPNLQNRLNRNTDYVCFAVYNATRTTTITAIKMAKRADLSYLMILPPGYADEDLHCYIALASASNKDTSNSVYLKFTNV